MKKLEYIVKLKVFNKFLANIEISQSTQRLRDFFCDDVITFDDDVITYHL